LAGQGSQGKKGQPNGNLYIQLRVNPHDYFTRDGNDLHLDVPITVGQAILGGVVRVPTLTGEVEVKVPPGTQPEEKRVLRGKGIKKIQSQQVGNQYLHFKIVIPKYVFSRTTRVVLTFQKEAYPFSNRAYQEVR
jgi:DnaJ-class molecular chaperone